MLDVDGGCEYVLDPDDPETWGGEVADECYVDEEMLNGDDVWTCPHDVEEDENLCIFHLPVEKKDDEEVVDAFLDALNEAATSDDPERRWLQFLGAKFGEFNMSENPPDITVKDRTLVINHAEIIGALDWSGLKIDVSSVNLSGTKCLGDTDFVNVEFGGDADFTGAEFRGDADFTGIVFGGDIKFRDVEFAGDILFGGAKFGEDASFSGAEFGEVTSFFDAKFEGEAYFNIAEFDGYSDFRGVEFGEVTRFFDAVFREDPDFSTAVFERNAHFRNVEFVADANFADAEFRRQIDFHETEFGEITHFNGAEFGGNSIFQKAVFGGNTTFYSAEFRRDAVFTGAEFGGDIDFDEAEFGGNTDFTGAEFGGGVDFGFAKFVGDSFFENLVLDEAQFRRADLTDTTFAGADLWDANFESALLSRATLFGADLRGARLSGAVLGDIRIDDETKFLGHPSENTKTSSHTFSAICSQPTCVYDPDYENDNEHEDVDKAKSVYRALEELGGKHARPRLQARSFVRRQDLQKQDYWDDAAADDASLEERLIAGARWSRARVARATLLYGESPWRVIAWSLGIILSFGLLYPLGGWMKAEGAREPLSYRQISADLLTDPLGWLGGFSNILADSLYYSTLTYTALGFGDFQPVNTGRLLTSIETGLGAVMLALLVFILGRRAAR